MGTQAADTQRITIKTHLAGKKDRLRKVALHGGIKDPAEGHDGITSVLLGEQIKARTNIADIRKGLPSKSISLLAKRLGTTEENLLPIVGISGRTWQRRLKDNKPFDLVESDRLYRIAKVLVHANDIFQNESIALDWLKSSNRVLGDTPLSLLDTEAGTDMVERVLERIAHGVYS